MTKRIYIISSFEEEDQLVLAKSAAEAVRYVARTRYGVRAATTLDVAMLMAKGIKVQAADPASSDGHEQMPLPQEADQ